MVDHYKVLGVSRKASQLEIKGRFKKLALQYHPDRNPGDQLAEEKFKEINRAYQTLSDPYKRHQYDFVLDYQYKPPRPSRSTSTYQPFYYPPFSKTKRAPSQGYQYGWPYLKSQLISFAFVFVIAALVLGVKHTYDKYNVGKEIRLAEVRAELFKESQAYFDQGEYRRALDIILEMYQKNRSEPSIRNYQDKFVGEIMNEAEQQFNDKDYESAITNFKIVSDYQRLDNPKVFLKMANCYQALGNYGEAVKNLDVVLLDDVENLKLNYQIASIYLDILDQPEASRPYFDRARKRVREILTQTYGRAAELVMNPKTTPKIYFDVFFGRAKVLTLMQDYEEGVNDANWSVFLDPDNAEAYFMRAQNYYGLGNEERACKNWKMAEDLGYSEASSMINRYCR